MDMDSGLKLASQVDILLRYHFLETPCLSHSQVTSRHQFNEYGAILTTHSI